MKKTKIVFDDVIKFSTGINLSRLTGTVVSDGQIYSIEDFENDLTGRNRYKEDIQSEITEDKGYIVRPGDCIISMIKSKAGIVSEWNSGKYLSINFVRCEIDRNEMYPWYFCYLFNEADSVKQQIYKNQQGTIKCISRLNLGTIGDIQVDLIEMERQKLIGDMYRKTLYQEYLMKHQAEQIKQFSFQMMKSLDIN